jgi:WD40 repeat protein
MLQALLLGGHRDAACAVLRALTTWAPHYLSYQEQQRYYRLYRTTSDMVGLGSGGTSTGLVGAGDSGGIAEAPTPRAAAELEAAGPPPFPAVPLDQFLKGSLVVDILTKLMEIAEKTRAAGGGSSRASSSSVVQGVATKLSDLGIKTTTTTTSASTASPGPSSVDVMSTGQLDMSAFMVMGGDGGFGSGIVVEPTAPVAPPAPAVGVSSAMDTGMLDLAAFGMDMMPPPEPPAAPVAAPAASSIETGALDLSSFGMAFDMPPPAPAVAPLVTQPVATNQPAMQPQAAINKTKVVVPRPVAPKQAAIPISELRPFSSELLTSLHQIVGLVASKEDQPGGLDQEESSEYSNHRDLSFLRGTTPSSRQNISSNSTTTAALDLLRSRPLNPLPGLTIEETQEVVAIATYFSSEGMVVNHSAASSTTTTDEAGAHFLTALNLACSRPFEDSSNMPFLTHNDSHLATRGSSSSAALASQPSSKSLHKTQSSASTAALIKRSKSVRNAAGVEYTLAPSMSSMASFSSVLGDEENCEDDDTTFEGGAGFSSSKSSSSDVLARRWGLAPGLQPSAVLWAQLSSSPQALLDHSLAKLAARDAEIAAFLQAEAVAQDASAADYLPKPTGGFVNSSSSSGSGANGPTWPALRAVGAGFWLHDPALLASTAEALAKSRFAANRNPDDAALFYAALGKKSVLQGLYRTTNQTRQADFLGRDFSQEKHQHAACKNAFVLMGNHRPELAAAFFILGASPGDAVSVCVRELGDVQLALFIARLLHGPGSEAERALVEKHILPAVLAAAGGSSSGQESGGMVTSLGGWARAATGWLLGDSSAVLKSILGLPTWPSPSSSDFTTAAVRDGPEGLVQLLPALALALAAQLSPTPSSSELPSIEVLKSALQERCATASEALQSAGLPALALQFEAVAAACSQSRENNGGSAVFSSSSSSSSGNSLRAAWACAAALLSHPSGTTQTSAIEKQLAALRAVGLDIDKLEALKRIHTLQKAINPGTHAATGAGGGGLGSLFSPRAAGGGPSSLLFRQGSFDTNRSTHSMHSSGSGGPRLSLDNHMRAHRHRAGSGAGAGQNQNQKPLPLSEGSIIFQVDSDSLHGVACCPLISPQVLGRPIITATHRHGLLEFAAQAPPTPPLQRHSSAALDSVPDYHERPEHPHSGASPLLLHTEDAAIINDLISEGSLPVSPHSPGATGGNEQSANMFSRFLSQIFDQSSWTLDPIESHDRTHSAVDGDIGLVVGASSGPLSPPAAGAGKTGSPYSTSSPSSTSERYSFSTSINPQNTRALTLAAHSSRQLFLSGCETSGRVQLWQFGGPRPVASFTPVSPNDLIATQADTGLLSFSFATRATTRSTSLVGRLGHWGGARSLAFSPNGERFAAVGDGGVVATWRLGGGSHRPTDVDGALCAEWWHHCLSKEGRAVVYIGGGGSVVAVGGKCSSGNIALWDAASPPAEACVGRLKHHSATVQALCTMPGGWLLAAADAGGALSLTDIRMLGGSTGGARTLWSVRASKGGVQSLVMLPLAATDRPRALAMGAASGGSSVLVSGGQDGIVRVWQASSGKLLQSMEGCSSTSQKSGGIGGGKGLLSAFGVGGGGGGSGGSSLAQGVTGLAVCDEGVVSCGADGTVRLFPLAS